jgi:large subunit ribosomal protein L13
MNYKSYLPKTDEIKREWHFIDAKGKVLGRLATKVADILRGKIKASYTPFFDCGDFVVITNAEKIVLTGKKLEQKIDYRHSGYPGGDRYIPYSQLMADNPEKAVMLAVKGMLQHNKLGRAQLTRLKVYRGAEHPHAAQTGVKKEKKATAEAK